MAFHVMHPDLVRYLLKGEQDILSDRNRERIDKIKSTPCPRCGASLHPKLREKDGFTDRDPLPRLWMTCECGYMADAETGMIVDRGSATKVVDPLPIIKIQPEE